MHAFETDGRLYITPGIVYQAKCVKHAYDVGRKCVASVVYIHK